VQSTAPPYQVEMSLIPETGKSGPEALNEEGTAALADRFATWLEQRGEAVLIHWEVRDLYQMSAYDYLTGYPLPLEYYSEIEDPDEPTRSM
jgi:hypothetical protein